MKNLSWRIRAAFCFVNTLALLCSTVCLPLRARGQSPNHRGKPVVITFGQPNVWSLDQAHYLLSQLRERSLDFTAARLAELDANETHGTRLDFMRQLFELAARFTQPVTSGSPTPTPSPAAVPASTPERVTAGNLFDGSALGKILADDDLRRRLFSDPKLNAVTKLDNHIQLQYEIIARQLTLLRDEVRPGERLVFLELPQSIYTTDDKADDKVAQVWWQVDGYNEYNPVQEIEKGIKLADEAINRLKPVAANMSKQSCGADAMQSYCREADGEKCKTLQEQCSKFRELAYWQDSRVALLKKGEEEKNAQNRRKVESLLQGGPADLAEVRTMAGKKFESVRGADPAADATTLAEYSQAKVRTVDIIPHQSSLNVNDVQETVKSSFIAASFAFLFGLGARTSFQRQRDQFEQFLHQELYASGFGKGDSLFGWTFGPLPGTKRVAPGLRTTFAALIVPDEAESIALSARGCFFHREDNEPPDAMNQQEGSKWWDDNDRECGAVKHYLLPIPSGGGTRNFWVTGIEYVPFKSPGQRMVALIKGENFSTQVGVLVNGVPLKHVVEVTRKLPASARNDANADCPGICGEYEVIGPNDISIAFEMPDGFAGTPEITVVGPGRSVTLDHLPMTVRPYGQGVFYELINDDTPFMFGAGPQVRIGDVRLFRDTGDFILGFLRGTKLNGNAEIFVNGALLEKTTIPNDLLDGKERAYFDSTKKMFRLRFKKTGDEKLDVMIVDGTDADTRTVANPFAEAKRPAPLAVTEDSVLALDAEQGEMAVRLTGTGLAKVTLKVLSGASAESEITSQSATELILRLVRPRVAVKIQLTNPETKEEVKRAIIRRPPPRSVTEKSDVVDSRSN
jgi:hypothetical protein